MESKFVSRAGEKLDFALEQFKIDVKGKVVADFGSSTGGFVDCLLKRGAEKIYSVDTAKNMLKYSLIENPKVEKIVDNAMYVEIPEVEFISIDVGWTRQKRIIPNAVKHLKVNGDIISLIKPQYEANKDWLIKGRVDEKCLGKTLDKVRITLKEIEGIKIMKIIESPIKGTKGKNVEFLMWIKKLE